MSGRTMTLTEPVSSSSVRNTKPLAVPGRWRVITRPPTLQTRLLRHRSRFAGGNHAFALEQRAEVLDRLPLGVTPVDQRSNAVSRRAEIVSANCAGGSADVHQRPSSPRASRSSSPRSAHIASRRVAIPRRERAGDGEILDRLAFQLRAAARSRAVRERRARASARSQTLALRFAQAAHEMEAQTQRAVRIDERTTTRWR